MCYSHEQKIGFRGELWALGKLLKLGYPAKLCPEFFEQSTDIKIGNMPIEVKIAQRKLKPKKRGNSIHLYPRYQWNVNSLHLTRCEFPLILIAQDGLKINHAFVMPASLARARGVAVMEINSHPVNYSGWFSRFLGDWSQIDRILKRWWGAEYRDVSDGGVL